jgi:hypothetical protein
MGLRTAETKPPDLGQSLMETQRGMDRQAGAQHRAVGRSGDGRAVRRPIQATACKWKYVK